jgi:hypothetical protein
MNEKRGLSTVTRNNWLMDAGLFLTGVVTIISGIYFLFIPGGYKGGRNPWYGVNILFSRETWDWLHTWIGVAMIAIAVIHVILHWKWFISLVKRFFKAPRLQDQPTGTKRKLNNAINVVLALSFLICSISGIYFLLFGGGDGGKNSAPAIIFSSSTWDLVHMWSGVLMIGVVFIHFVNHWGWVSKVTAKLLTRRKLLTVENANI